MSEDVTREVDRLLKDRARYQDWLNRLEDQKPRASEQAYGRVRADYQKRLEDVLSRLQEHGEALHGRLQDIERHAEELKNQRGERSDRLDEARLRRSVGEYTDEREWSELENRLSTALEEADRQLADTHSEIERLKEILASVAGAPAERPSPTEPAETERPAEAVVEASPSEPRSPVEARPEHPSSGPGEGQLERPAPDQPPQMAEPWETPESERPAGGSAEEPEAPEPTADEGFPPGVQRVGEAPEPEPAGDDEGFLSLEELILDDEDLVGSEIEERQAAEPEPEEPDAEEKSQAPGVGDELAFLESLSLSGGEEKEESFSFLEQHGSGSARTIVCPHCSAANDPAEWYCTECGEELPAE